MPVEEQFDKEKAKAEVQDVDAAAANDKPAPTPSLGALPGVKLTDAEKQKYEAEMAKLYKEMDDKVMLEDFYLFCPFFCTSFLKHLLIFLQDMKKQVVFV